MEQVSSLSPLQRYKFYFIHQNFCQFFAPYYVKNFKQKFHVEDPSTGTLNVKKLCKVFTNVKMIKC